MCQIDVFGYQVSDLSLNVLLNRWGLFPENTFYFFWMNNQKSVIYFIVKSAYSMKQGTIFYSSFT